MKMKSTFPKASLPLIAWLVTVPLSSAFAHTGNDVALGLQSGFLHPLTGVDHLVAMVAVGVWGAQLGNPAVWVLPITFPLVMAVGGLLGLLGMPLPFTEQVVALSGLALGLMVALWLRTPLWIAAVLVGIFAIFHGYAHGRELPGAADPVAYAVGFVVATGLLHLAGILIGTITQLPAGATVVRACGVVIGCTGLYFFLAAVGLAG